MITITNDLKAKLGTNTYPIDMLQLKNGFGTTNMKPISKVFKDTIIEGATFDNFAINNGVVTIIKNIE